MDDRWGDTGTWVGELRREAFFFASGNEQLYGSLYAAVSPTPTAGVAICNSWGFEGNQSDATIHRIALATARAGGAGLVFHYPGFGDSHGDLAEATIETLVGAAVDAVGEASRRLPGVRWTLAGLMFGTSVAALAASRAGIDRLLLIQPVLQPSAYFTRLERSARRAAVRVPARAGNAYGYPLPHRILEDAAAVDATVAGALGEFGGEGAVVRYDEPPRSEPVPERFEDVVIPGRWRFGSRQKPELAKAASGWLRRADAEGPG
jgi:alpha/beta superfamily hydrolase